MSDNISELIKESIILQHAIELQKKKDAIIESAKQLEIVGRSSTPKELALAVKAVFESVNALNDFEAKNPGGRLDERRKD